MSRHLASAAPESSPLRDRAAGSRRLFARRRTWPSPLWLCGPTRLLCGPFTSVASPLARARRDAGELFSAGRDRTTLRVRDPATKDGERATEPIEPSPSHPPPPPPLPLRPQMPGTGDLHHEPPLPRAATSTSRHFHEPPLPRATSLPRATTSTSHHSTSHTSTSKFHRRPPTSTAGNPPSRRTATVRSAATAAMSRARGLPPSSDAGRQPDGTRCRWEASCRCRSPGRG